MKRVFLGVALIATMFGCSSVDSNKTEEESFVRVGITNRLQFKTVKFVDNSGKSLEYYTYSSASVDTMYVNVFDTDSVIAITTNIRGDEYNFIKVVQDSVYKLKYK